MNKILVIFIVIALLSICASAFPEGKSLFKQDERVPSDAIILFDGKNSDNWTTLAGEPCPWVVRDSYMEVIPETGYMRTKQEFKDVQLHVEFWLPAMPDADRMSRANSGVFLQGCYEIQILDSSQGGTLNDDCGGMYSVISPIVNACRPPEHWQTYDAIYRAPRFDADNKMITNPRITVMQNGVVIHNNVEIPRTTVGEIVKGQPKAQGPLLLQDHLSRVRFRNIWIRPLSQ